MTRFKIWAVSLLFMLTSGGAVATSAPVDTLTLKRVESADLRQIRRVHAINFALSADVPSEDETMRREVTAWLRTILTTDLDITPKTSFEDEEAMAEFFRKTYIERGRKELLELAKERENDSIEVRVTYSYDLTVRKAYETAKFITFEAESYAYMGGAHGLNQKLYATFRKEDGKILTWDDILLPKRKSQFQAAVADALLGYFGTTTFQEMKTRLLVDDDCTRTTFPLPANAPGLLAKGLCVQYVDYEIAPHAAGIPSVTIPYKQMKGFWTPMAVKLWR